MTEWIKWLLGILFTIGIVGGLNEVVDGLKPESWTNRHYRRVKALDVLLNIVLLFLVVLYL